MATFQQDLRFSRYCDNLGFTMGPLQYVLAYQDMISWEEDTHEEMDFDTFRERIVIRQGGIIVGH